MGVSNQRIASEAGEQQLKGLIQALVEKTGSKKGQVRARLLAVRCSNRHQARKQAVGRMESEWQGSTRRLRNVLAGWAWAMVGTGCAGRLGQHAAQVLAGGAAVRVHDTGGGGRRVHGGYHCLSMRGFAMLAPNVTALHGMVARTSDQAE